LKIIASFFTVIVILFVGLLPAKLKAQATLVVPDTTQSVLDTLWYPVHLELNSADDIYGVGFELSFDSLQFTLLDYSVDGTVTKSTNGAFYAVNAKDNEVYFSLAATNPIDQSGVLLYLQLVPKVARISQIQITEHQFNEEALQSEAIRASIITFGNTPPQLIGLPDTLQFNQNDTLRFSLAGVIQDAEDDFADLDFELSLNPPVIFVELIDSTSTLLIYSPFFVGEVVLSGSVTDNEGLTTEFSIVILIEEAVTNEFMAQSAYSYQLMQNYPNPFNPNTKIAFSIENPAEMSLRVYDLSGRMVIELWNQYTPSGYHELHFDASHLSSGTYIYRLMSRDGDVYLSKKMLLVK